MHDRSSRRRAALALLVTALAAVPAGAVSTSIPPTNQPLAGPPAALERYAQAWRDRSADAVASALTADYVYHAYDTNLRGFLDGNAREMEMRVMRGLLEGVKRDGKLVMAP